MITTTDMNKQSLEVRGVSKAFGGVQALDDVSLEIERGKVTALVGDNGAGKSTLVRLLSGVNSPDRGSFLIGDRELRLDGPISARSYGIETVFQELALADNLDVAANIFLGRELSGNFSRLFRLRKSEMARHAKDLLQRYGVNVPSPKSRVNNLSGGQRQGVAIARAVRSGDTKFILMDEPTAALGVQETAKVLSIVRSLAEEGLGVLLISHNMKQVVDTADNICVLRRGRVVSNISAAETTTQELVHLITTGSRMSDAQF